MLDFLNYNETVLIGTSAGYDDFGIPVQSELTEVKCYIRESENLEPITAIDGSQFVISYYISVAGKCQAGVGDTVNIDGQKMVIRSKKYIKDFDLNIISTKFGV